MRGETYAKPHWIMDQSAAAFKALQAYANPGEKIYSTEFMRYFEDGPYAGETRRWGGDWYLSSSWEQAQQFADLAGHEEKVAGELLDVIDYDSEGEEWRQ